MKKVKKNTLRFLLKMVFRKNFDLYFVLVDTLWFQISF